ncbi:MAG: FAD-binding oxidoreductase [Promethearchaeota archaeon]
MTIIKRDIYELIDKESVLKELRSIFGEKYVSNKPVDLYPYSYDATESDAYMPDFVVLPQNIEEIIELAKFANKYKIPIIPYTSGNNVGGLTIPEQGGIICDMGKRMKKIIKVHESMMYAIIEPGVTWGQLKRFLEKYYPNLKYGYTYAPPYAGVLANAILSGMSNLSTAYGCTADWINGLEVVLSTGEIVRTGSCFLSNELKDDNWFARYPIPDLTGLFMCWQGTTGIVTKAAIQLWPNKKYKTVLVVLVYGADECAELVKEIGRTECCEDVSAMNIEIIKMTFGLKNPPKFEKEPDFGIVITISAHTKPLLSAKVDYVKEIFEKIRENSQKNMFLTNFSTFVNLLGEKFAIYYDLPTVITPMVEFSGVTWVGCYGSTDNIGFLFKRCYEIFKEYKREPLMFMKSMKYSHYCAFMTIIRYNQSKEKKKVKELQRIFLELMLKNDCIPYKTPRWMTEIIRQRCDINWIKLLERIKKVMDPNNIFNPGKWNLFY